MATDVIPIPALAPDLNPQTSDLEKGESVPLKPQSSKLTKMPDHSYSRVEMMKLKEHPRSKLRPNCLDLAYFTSKGKSPGVWDPEHWHAASRGGERGDKEVEKRGYKNDRGKEEELKGDEFILTPQRRSFVSGCHVSLPSAPPPAPATLAPAIVEKEVRGTGLIGTAAGAGRRVGSGRVGQDRERESVRREWPERTNNDRSNGAPDRERTERTRGVREFDDRRFQRDDRGERRFSRDDYGRYDRNSTRRNHHHEEEPEWFSGGPISQSDTIELKGFDEEDKKKKTKNEKEKREAKSPQPQPNGAQVAKEKVLEEVPPLVNGKQSRPPSQAEPRPLTPPPANKEQNPGDFSMEEILKMEFPMGEEMLEVCTKSSRFSQWFSRQEERKSPTDLMQQLGLREPLKEASAPAPPPVAAAGPEVNLLSLLNRNKPIVMRAEQLEGENGPSGDMGAFQQLIAQLGGKDSKPPSQAPPPVAGPQPQAQASGSAVDPRGLALMQLLGAKAQVAAVAPPPPVGPAHPALRHAPTEEDILAGRVQPSGPHPAHILQQQQLSALANQQQLQQRAMVPPVLPPTLQRPETLAMIRAVQNGEASRQHLYHQLQQAALMRQRAPAPDAALSYLFLQNALEEQAKQQQQQQAQTPPQPARIAMAFTPTSVIRKMTADKDVKQRHHVSGASTPDVNADRKSTDTPPPAHSTTEPVTKPSKPVGQPTGRTASQMANFVPPQAQAAPQPQQPRPVSKPDAVQGGNNINDVAALLFEQQHQHQMLAAAMSAAAAAAAQNQQPRSMPANAQPQHNNLFRQNQPPPPTYVRPPPFANVPPMFLPPQAPPPSVLAQQQRAANAQLQQLLRQHNAGTSRQVAGTGGSDLARWFTPELLSAGAGIAHGRQGLTGPKVLSLEELERQQAAMPH